jgi:hypothetical protein
LNDFRTGLHKSLHAFKHDYFGQTMTTSSSRQRNYLAAFWPESATQMKEMHHIAEDGPLRCAAVIQLQFLFLRRGL